MSNSDATIEKLTAELRKLKSSLNRDSTILLIAAVLLFAVFLGYFVFGYNQFKEISEPKKLMDAAETLVRENIKEVRGQLENEVDQNADKWAEMLSDRALASVGGMRQSLETFVTDQVKEKIKESVARVEPEFDKMISENNEVLKNAFKELKEDEDISDDLVQIIVKEVNTRLKTSVQNDAKTVLNNMIMLKAKMRKLTKGESLSEEEALERQILATARQIQDSNESK